MVKNEFRCKRSTIPVQKMFPVSEADKCVNRDFFCNEVNMAICDLGVQSWGRAELRPIIHSEQIELYPYFVLLGEGHFRKVVAGLRPLSGISRELLAQAHRHNSSTPRSEVACPFEIIRFHDTEFSTVLVSAAVCLPISSLSRFHLSCP